MRGPFAGIYLLDQHAHSLLRVQPATPREFRACFTESDAAEIIDHHVPWSLFYRRALRDLATFFGCVPTESAVFDARARWPLDRLTREMFTDAGIAGVLVDLGLRPREHYDLEELRVLIPCPAFPVLRLETLAERLIPDASTWADFQDRFVDSIERAARADLWALKTIIGYRTGLALERWTREALEQAFRRTRAEFLAGHRRLQSKPLLDTLLRQGLEVAARHRLPVQIHAGFGDRDLDLRLVNPVWLRPIIEDPAFREAPLVLLHCHPYVREAAWLASVYPHVYLDLSLTVPFLAHGASDAVVEALAMAPATKILLATDAFSIPELFWLGARHAREAVDAAARMVEARGFLPAEERDHVARLLLHDNAATLYGIDAPPGR
ncbi:MAG TPA: amidohydrolase family protein [bacterium]|nr:amidohydrolase family protein [bacterium]